MKETVSQNIDELLDRAIAKDRTAFSQLMRLMMNKTVALTYKMTGDKDSALDLAQETFISAWEKMGSFKKEAKFESWLYRIAVNKTLNYLKKKKQQPLEDYEQFESSSNPENDYHKKQLRENILFFMNQLPQQQKIVFELHFYKEMTFEEVAAATGKALGTVKTLYREAVIKLRSTAQTKGWIA